MIDLNRVTIYAVNFDAQGSEEIYQNLRTLYTTPVGTVPFDRDFGVNFDILDNSLPVAQGRLTVEYIEKTRKYENRAIVKEVDFIDNTENGLLIPKVVIEIVNNS